MEKKLAIFVEGFTELLFVERLLSSIAGTHNVRIESRKMRGGSRAPLTINVIRAARNRAEERYFVLIIDCGGDAQVKTRIQEEHANLTAAHFEKIIGVRDVRPEFTLADVPRLELGLRTKIRTNLIPVEFMLAVMEVEAWFLAEHSHLPKIEACITVESVMNRLGFDPSLGDLSERLTPSIDLDQAYQIGGKNYIKGSPETINALDMEEVYLVLGERIPYVAKLIKSLDSFFM